MAVVSEGGLKTKLDWRKMFAFRFCQKVFPIPNCRLRPIEPPKYSCVPPVEDQLFIVAFVGVRIAQRFVAKASMRICMFVPVPRTCMVSPQRTESVRDAGSPEKTSTGDVLLAEFVQ